MAVKTILAEIKDIPKYPALPVTATSLDVGEITANDTNGIDFVASGREIIIAHNTTGGALTFTLVSVADPFGRTGDITSYSVGAGLFSIVPTPVAGFAGAGGKIQITVSAVGLKFLALRAPNVL